MCVTDETSVTVSVKVKIYIVRDIFIISDAVPLLITYFKCCDSSSAQLMTHTSCTCNIVNIE